MSIARQGMAERATALLSRLLLLLGLLLPHALQETTRDASPESPAGALLALADQEHAILLQDAPRAAASQLQDDTPAFWVSATSIPIVASRAVPTGLQHPFPAKPILDLYLRPFAQGPPLV